MESMEVIPNMFLTDRYLINYSHICRLIFIYLPTIYLLSITISRAGSYHRRIRGLRYRFLLQTRLVRWYRVSTPYTCKIDIRTWYLNENNIDIYSLTIMRQPLSFIWFKCYKRKQNNIVFCFWQIQEFISLFIELHHEKNSFLLSWT